MPTRRALGIPVGLCALLVICVLSLAIGSLPLAPSAVWHGLIDPASGAYPVVHETRLPRTLLGLLAGLALGLAGAVMQALTRNPLADPGLLGVNAGASAAVVTATALLGVSTLGGYIWFALSGAALVSALIYAVGGAGSSSPARLALTGTAVNAVLYSYVGAVELLDTDALDRMRFWTVGSLADAHTATVRWIAPFILVGALLALGSAKPLNAMVLGNDVATALGGKPALTRAVAIAAIVLLAGSATAACGPIVFVGLIVPQIAARCTGPDLRWVLPYSAILAPILLLGVVTALLIPALLLTSRPLRVLELGDDLATGLGLRGERLRLVTLALAVLLAASAAAQTGPVAFVALCAPHLARRMTLRNGPNLVPSLLVGAALMEWADYLAQHAIPDRELPVGVVTGVLGGGYLVLLLAHQRRIGRL
jgi:iron complex transport system permease protein